MRPKIRARLELTGLLLLSLLAACGRRPPAPATDAEPRGAALVVGTSRDEWGLLVVPREGGLVSLRSLRAPREEVWAGTQAVPASVEAHALEDGIAVLRAADGAVYRFDPRADEVVRVDRVGGNASWVSGGGSGLFLDPEAKAVLQISTGGNWRYAVRDSVLWAAPVERDAIALLVGSDAGRELWILREGESQPAERLSIDVSPPGLVTAWGRRLVFAGTGAHDGRLRVLTVGPLGAGTEIPLGGESGTLLASPSSHEIYAAVGSPPTIVAVSRFTGSIRPLITMSAPLDGLRVSLFGESLLAASGGSVVRVPVSGGEPARLGLEWGPDLPIGLPGGRTLGERDGRLVLLDTNGEGVELGDGAADWWMPVRWRPASEGVVADRLRGERVAQVPGAAGGAETAPVDSAPGPPGRPARAGAADAPPGPAPGRTGEVAPGFYAIVGSARSAAGIGALVRSLDLAGYRTAVQRFPDDAGQVWHRGLVGPYPSRGAAEAAARQLERERRLQTWVTEITDLQGAGGAP
ncbi:MAG: SPOR domain-containing protein [Gemmatimonadota bacterium]